MAFWAFFGILFVCLSGGLAFWDLSSMAEELHFLCLKKLSWESSMTDIYKSLVCGKRLPEGQLKGLFIQGGLIHLTVVSGAHLLFLEKFWKKLPLPVFLKTYGVFVILILYALISRMYPPVTRALFSFFLFRLSQSLKLFWSAGGITLLSGILCLIYQPRWADSFSLQLSLLASLLYSLPTNSIKKCFFIYVFILPVVNRWQALHPLTVLLNWTLAPLIASLLFPLSFLSPMIPILYPVTDFLWAFPIQVLKIAKLFPSESPLMQWFIPKEWIWPYIGFVCFVIFIFGFFQKKRQFHNAEKNGLAKPATIK